MIEPGSPDKGPAAPPALVKEHRAAPRRRNLWQLFREEFWAANTFMVTFLAVVLALVAGAIIMIIADPETRATWSYFFARPGDALQASWGLVSEAYANLFKGAIADPDQWNRWFWNMAPWQQALYPISETLQYAAPLALTGLSFAVAFRAGLFSIGAQGQATMGSIAGALAGFLISAPGWLHVPVALLCGLLGGMLWGFLPGWLKAKTGAHEVITTIMLNYIAFHFLTWIVIQKGIQDPSRSDAISSKVDETARLPLLFDPSLRANLGIVLALLATAFVGWMLKRSTFGFELRAVGANPDAARTAGMSVAATIILVMTLAGGLAGLGGATMVLGTAYALTPSVVGTIGFDGILVALLGRARPWGVLAAALLFGALQAGGNRMQSFSGISLELVGVIQALIAIFVAAPALVKAIVRLRESRTGGAAELAKG
ncbi:ABC transporter permease [Allorhizocola rhizosphaerae]|uniref:ABC transporter permease n=1 Tax=Allorhizocola rhizosphaerae TaxID=1872709 RepID=UPI000E3D558D|nr:ABC transporter permease [Allorhizocola rhizosphaerae]